MEDPQAWAYFVYHSELKSKRTKICITCPHFRYSTTDQCVTILTCPLRQKLITQREHLVKGFKFWRNDKKIFEPEAAKKIKNGINTDIQKILSVVISS